MRDALVYMKDDLEAGGLMEKIEARLLDPPSSRSLESRAVLVDQIYSCLIATIHNHHVIPSPGLPNAVSTDFPSFPTSIDFAFNLKNVRSSNAFNAM